MLAEVVVSEQGAIPALCQAIVQGCCRGVEKLDLPCFNGVGRNDHPNLLGGALEVEETLPALTTLWCCQMRGVLPKLTKALMGGAAPLLKHIRIGWGEPVDDDMDPISDMRRARIPRCSRLDYLEWESDWFDETSEETRMHLLRALLPSVTKLHWYPGYMNLSLVLMMCEHHI